MMVLLKEMTKQSHKSYRCLRLLVTEIFKKVSKANLKVIQLYFVIKTYCIFLAETLFCRHHLQSIQFMERILCILNMHAYGTTFLILLNPVRRYLNLKVWKHFRKFRLFLFYFQKLMSNCNFIVAGFHQLRLTL